MKTKLYGNLYPSGHMRLSVELLKKINYNFKSPYFAELSLNKSKTQLIMKLKDKKENVKKIKRNKLGIGFNGIVVCARNMWKKGKMHSHKKYPVLKATSKEIIFSITKNEKYKGVNSFWRR